MTDSLQSIEAKGLTPDERQAVETFYRAFAGKPELLDQAVTPDWRDIPLAPGQAPGRDGMKPLIQGFAAAFPDTKVTIHEIFGSPGRAGVRAEITATHMGEWFSEQRATVEAALRGVGVAFWVESELRPLIEAGRLLPLLTDYAAEFPGFSLCYPRHRHQSAAVRALIEHLRRTNPVP